MPNYNLVINSTFQPFSFEEMLQPVMIAQAAHREVEDAYSELSTKAGEFEALAESEKLRNGADSNTYKRYSTYANDLKKQADELATRGLKSGTRKSLMDLKTRYSTDIKPIQEAKEKLKTLVDERKKFEIAYPTLKYERDYSDIGVDELLDNPNLTFGRTYTGSLIEEQVGKSASALLKQIRTDPKYSKILGGQYFQSKMQQGYTMEEVLLAAAEDPKAPKELSDLMNSAIINSGVKDWEGMYDSKGNLTAKGKAVMEDVKSYAARGLNYAVGTTTFNTISNKAYDYAMQAAIARQRQTPPKPQPDLKLRHWSTPLGKEEINKVNSLKSVVNSIFTKGKDGNMSLITGKDGKTYNPMQVFEDYAAYYAKNPTNKVYHKSFYPGSVPVKNYINTTPETAKEYIQKKYGVDPITVEQYNVLKELGYNSSATVEAFNNLPTRLNTMVTQYNPTSLNAVNYDNLGERFYGSLNREGNDAIKMVKANGDRVKVDSSALFDKDGNAIHKISDMAYDIRTPDKVYMQIAGNVYEVDLNLLGLEAANIGARYKGINLSNYSIDDVSAAQDNAAYILRRLFTDWAANPSETVQGGQ